MRISVFIHLFQHSVTILLAEGGEGVDVRLCNTIKSPVFASPCAKLHYICIWKNLNLLQKDSCQSLNRILSLFDCKQENTPYGIEGSAEIQSFIFLFFQKNKRKIDRNCGNEKKYPQIKCCESFRLTHTQTHPCTYFLYQLKLLLGGCWSHFAVIKYFIQT